VQHDSRSVLAMATNTLHNALCITLNLFKNLRLRIAIVRSAWRQPNILLLVDKMLHPEGDVQNLVTPLTLLETLAYLFSVSLLSEPQT